MFNQGQQLEEKKLKLSLWWVTHKIALHKIGRIILIVLAVLPWLFFIIYLSIYLVNIDKTSRMLEELGSIKLTTQELTEPQPINILTTKPFETSSGVYDVFAEIKNNNENFAGEFFYQFNIGSTSTEPKKTFILPGESKYLSSLNLNIGTSSIAQADLTLTDIKWQRIVHPENLPKTNFIFKDLKYSLVELAGDGQGVQSEVTGKVLNQSAYGFDKVEVTVVLYFNNQPQAVKSTFISQFFSGSEKPLKFTWSKKYPFNTEIKAQATTNILDEENLILP